MYMYSEPTHLHVHVQEQSGSTYTVHVCVCVCIIIYAGNDAGSGNLGDLKGIRTHTWLNGQHLSCHWSESLGNMAQARLCDAADLHVIRRRRRRRRRRRSDGVTE